MYSAQKQCSEVARLLAQMSSEWKAVELGLSELAAGTNHHTCITQKIENVGNYHQELQNLVGEMPAIAMIAEQLERYPEAGPSVS